MEVLRVSVNQRAAKLQARGRYFAEKKPKNAQGCINSAQAKFSESPKKVFLLPKNEEITMCFALNRHF